MMTREEASTHLFDDWYIENGRLCVDESNRDDFCKALGVGIKALRPVSRERVEKVWTGCDICRGDKKIKSDNFCGAATMQIVGDSIDLCGDEKKIKFFGHVYAPSFSVRFCPFCGKPLTDEAVQMVMERLEALKDG